MRIAIVGTRGVPASYGGFETFAEELGRRLVERNHEVTVYGRPGFIDPTIETYLGMRIVVVPAIRSKHLETVSNTLVTALHLRRKDHDVILMCNAANAPFIPMFRLRGLPVALNVDGLERNRRKWGWAGRSYYRLCERWAARWPNAVITDAEVIRRYYRRAYKVESTMIAYGADLPRPESTNTLDALGVEAGEYALYVSRFEPENNPDRVAAAWVKTSTTRKLVMLGGAPYAPELIRKVAGIADHRVILPGPIYGEGYRQLLFNCRLYIHATEVGGTHPALIEAMGAGRPVVAFDTPENREVIGPTGSVFRFGESVSLDTLLDDVLEDNDRLTSLGRGMAARATAHYSWEAVTDSYEALLESLC